MAATSPDLRKRAYLVLSRGRFANFTVKDKVRLGFPLTGKELLDLRDWASDLENRGPRVQDLWDYLISEEDRQSAIYPQDKAATVPAIGIKYL